ncbi:MAG TPA: MFS transporter [Acidobacteriaceae bacterium]|jgi:NNP family nitrate/nitrite transporter-like MFS transporter|nr:MFS transporter [Acidobacteriaceae bacterium]
MSNRRHVVLGTVSFMVCFAAWGLIGAFAPRFREAFHLTPSETALLVAIPVLLGSLARLPMGILTDRFGGRAIFSILMAAVAIPVWMVPQQTSYSGLLMVAFLLGLAGSSFAIGVGYVSRWTPAAQQGSALGVYGLGNMGQSAAVFLGPVIAARVGMASVYRGVAVILVVWAVAFGFLARNAPAPASAQRKGLGAVFEVLLHQRLSWLLAAFYFLTFGGFVAFSIYLPTLLKDEFHLTPADAGFRTAGFVILATLLRPAGGLLSDRIGGARVLSAVFLGVVPFAMLMAWSSMIPFTVGALGCAALLGMGNGAVFKLVPQYFPTQTGTVTGLVGAMGGLGGFFPPLLLAYFRSHTGAIWPGFVLLSGTAMLLWWANHKVFVPRQQALDLTLPADLRRTADRARAGAWATLWTALLVSSIVVGSRNLQNFDPALVIYTFAVVFAAWGVIYHYNVWLEKPPTRLYWDRGWELYRRGGILRSLGRVLSVGATHLVAQRFIAHRSRLRWWMHQCLFWGCMLAVAITFPLVFGWIHFRTLPGDQMIYVTYMFGFATGSFRLHTVTAWLLFHGLDISAVLVLAGIALSLWRRMTDKGARTVQQFGMDFLPIIMLFAISVTGLALTVSQEWMRGSAYSFLAILHAITVIAALLFLPFGKFFHIFQRPAQLGVKLYQDAGAKDPGAHCVRCGERFASQMHIDDLRAILPQVGFQYATPGPAGHWQALCPACKRKSLSMAQLRIREESRG